MRGLPGHGANKHESLIKVRAKSDIARRGSKGFTFKSMSPFPCHSQIDILEKSIKNRPIDKSHKNLQTK